MENKKRTLLLADDEAHIRTLMKTIIKPLEFDSIVEAKNGQEAITIFKDCAPALTLLDINMPLITGIDALKEIKKIDPNASVIMMTSLNDHESVKTCIENGASNYILKDNPIEEIKSMVLQTWKELE
jgi:two-component system chemotaxis response regulator CheY